MLQLGNFVKLPVEVRFLIWDELFSAIETIPKSENEPSAKLLSILRCSSSLYEEVSSQLYHGLKHIIHMNSVYRRSYFVKAVVSSKKISCMRKLQDRAALRSHIMRFPFSKIEELHIIISSPKQDIGHAISLWLKVNGIALVLANLKCCLKLRISLTEGWMRNKQPRAQGFRFAGVDHCIYDYDLAILPFTGSGLSGWSFDMPHTLVRQISEEPSDRPNSLLHYIHKHGIKITGSSCPMADAWMAKTRCLLDIILDETSGTMLEQLRRDRYMNWFSADGISTKCYEQQFLKDLERHHEDLLRYDRYCQRRINRRCMLLSICADTNEKSVSEFSKNFRILTSEEWLSKFPRGIRPLNHSTQRYSTNPLIKLHWTISPLINSPLGELTEDLHWWAFNASVLFSETEFPCRFFNCSLCLKYKAPCRWCKKFDYLKRCEFCRVGLVQPTLYEYDYNYWHQRYVPECLADSECDQ